MTKSILVTMNPSRPDAVERANYFAKLALSNSYTVYSPFSELIAGSKSFSSEIANELQIAVVFGGDGTILRAAEILHKYQTPIVGINLGSVGFLAEISEPQLEHLLALISEGKWKLEPRATLEFNLIRNGNTFASGWALNEVTVERSSTQMVELFLSIDGKPVSRWGCDSVICASPTGSTAYAFSAGGPVIWPEVEALSITPVANHGLFSRTMIISSHSIATIDIESNSAGLVADGVRNFVLEQGDRVEVKVSKIKVNLAHFDDSVFTDRLVAKFRLPISGWRR
jgi:NAD+ kinase